MDPASQTEGLLRAGAAQGEITPEAGVHIAGTVNSYRPAAFVLDPIYAKALFLESWQPGAPERMICIVALDVVIVTDQYVRAIRRFVAERFGLDPNAVLVHAVQNHTGPSLGHFLIRDDEQRFPSAWSWLRGGDDRYHPYALDRIYQCLEAAHAALRPVQVGVGSGIEGRVAFPPAAPFCLYGLSIGSASAGGNPRSGTSPSGSGTSPSGCHKGSVLAAEDDRASVSTRGGS
jgi:hypothetical protein